jgi:hypothetical protein
VKRALPAAALLLAMAGTAAARQTAAQELFRDKLLDDRSVTRDVKTRLRKGGFVDRRVTFEDLTGEGRSDAIVLVHSGGSAGRIALYVFSAGTGEDLRIVYRNQELFRATATVRAGSLFYRVPRYERGDELCCPAAEQETELRWSSRTKRFRVVSRRTIETTPASG